MEFRRPFPNSGNKVPANTADYIIFGEDTDGDGIADVIYAKNGKTGEVEYQGNKVSSVIEFAVENLPHIRPALRGGRIHLNGLFKLTESIILDLSDTYVLFSGNGIQGTRIEPQGDFPAFVINNSVYGFKFLDITFDAPNPYTSYLLEIYGEWGEISGCYFGDGNGIALYDGQHNIHHNWFEGQSTSIYAKAPDTHVALDISINNNFFTSVKETATTIFIDYNSDAGKAVQYGNITNNLFVSYATAINRKYIVLKVAKFFVVSNNFFYNANYGIQEKGYFTVGPQGNIYDNNVFRAVTNPISKWYYDSTHYSDAVISNNYGYTTKSSGMATFTGDGSTTTFSVAHGLVAQPSKYFMQPLNDLAKGYSTLSADATYLYVNFSSAPPSGSTLSYYWYAEV